MAGTEVNVAKVDVTVETSKSIRGLHLTILKLGYYDHFYMYLY